jgi:hypothetical protein
MIEAKLRHTEDRLADCENDRLEIWQQLAHLSIHEKTGKQVNQSKNKN